MKQTLDFKSSSRMIPPLLLGMVCLGLLTAQAESTYHKSPRLGPRNRQTVPTASPLLNSTDSAASARDAFVQDGRVHQGPPPAWNAGEIPVSYQAQAQPKSQTTRGAGHPVVVGPEPLSSGRMTGTDTQAVPVRVETRVERKARLSREKAARDAEKRLTRQENREIEAERKAASKAKKSPSAATESQAPVQGAVQYKAAPKAQASASDVKPLVHFPEDLKAAKKRMQKAKGFEHGFYPVGYRPYVVPQLTLEAVEHQAALMHYNRGSFYGHTSQMNEAIQEYQRAIRKNPALADAYVGLSSAYMFKNNWEDAIINANQALSMRHGFIDPANITQAQYNLSTAYCAAADYRKSRRYYKMVKSANHAQTDDLWRYIEKNCKP